MKHPIITSLAAIAFVAAIAGAGITWAEDPAPGGMPGDHGGMHDHMQQMQDMHEQMHGQKDEKKSGGMHDHSTAGAPKSDGAKSDATRAYEEANAKMHRDMGAALTGDPDVDFMQGMIPHHQGAIDMAEVVLKYGKDPEVRKLAEAVVKAQTGEIAFMKDWLAKHSQ